MKAACQRRCRGGAAVEIAVRITKPPTLVSCPLPTGNEDADGDLITSSSRVGGEIATSRQNVPGRLAGVRSLLSWYGDRAGTTPAHLFWRDCRVAVAGGA